MNPFKPLFQYFEDLYRNVFSNKELVNKLYLKLNLTKSQT